MSESLKRYCVMPSCKGEKFDLVHKFPRNDTRAQEWLDIINLPELIGVPLAQIRKSKFICTRHFAPEAYKHQESRSLNINAVPSRNLECLETLDHIIARERKSRNNIGPYKQVCADDEVETATKFFEIETLEQETELEVKSQVTAPPKRKNLREELCKLIPVNKRKKIIDENALYEHTTLHTAVPIEVVDISNVIESIEPLPNPLDNMLDDIMEEIPVVPEELISTNNEATKLDYLEIIDEVKYPGEFKLNYFWLRDHCQCEKCFDKETNQRKINLTDISLDIRPLEYNIEDDKLRMKWPDEHESFYSLDFLYNSQYTIRRPIYEKSQAVLWTSETIQKMDFANVDLSDLLCTENAVRTVLKSLLKYGVAFINKVPTNQHSTEMTITRLFPLMKTFYGEMWTFSDNKDHHDFAYTNNYLPAHSDNTYFNDAAGLQILHCIQHQGEGGENFLVDGFHVLNELKRDHPEVFQRLTEYQIPSEYIEEGRNHRHIGPIIKLNSFTGEPEQLRFNMNDRAIVDTIPFDKIQQFYSDVQFLAKQMQNKTNEWKFKLKPGTVMFFDNWRLLHGRTAYTGKRVMTGAYVLRTEFMSAARVAGVLS